MGQTAASFLEHNAQLLRVWRLGTCDEITLDTLHSGNHACDQLLVKVARSNGFNIAGLLRIQFLLYGAPKCRHDSHRSTHDPLHHNGDVSILAVSCSGKTTGWLVYFALVLFGYWASYQGASSASALWAPMWCVGINAGKISESFQ